MTIDCPEKYLKRLVGKTDIEDSLERLDKLTHEEARMASAELLKIAHSIERTVTSVDDKLDQANSSSFLQSIILHSEISNIPQGTSSGITFFDGFRLRTHRSIIILRLRPITRARLNGSFKAEYSRNGNPLVPSCGYTENVRPSVFRTRQCSSHTFIAGSGKSVLWFVLPLITLLYNIYIANSAPQSFKI